MIHKHLSSSELDATGSLKYGNPTSELWPQAAELARQVTTSHTSVSVNSDLPHCLIRVKGAEAEEWPA